MPATLRPFSSFSPAAPCFLWHPYLPTGHLTLLLGSPAAGKTTLALHLAARLSTADPATPGPRFPAPQDTLLLSAHPPASLRARLDLLPADLSRIHLLGLHSLTTPGDIQALADALEELPHPGLLIVDPLTLFLGSRVSLLDRVLPDTHGTVVGALANLAERFEIAILLTAPLPRQLPRSADPAEFRDRALRLLPIAALPASVHLLLPHTPPSAPGNPAVDTSSGTATKPPAASLLLPLKSPTPTLPPPAAFALGDTLTWLDPPPDLAPDRTADPDAQLLQDAIVFITNALAYGPVTAQSITDGAALNAIPRRQLARAKAALGIVSKRAGYQRPWYWLDPRDPRPIPK